MVSANVAAAPASPFAYVVQPGDELSAIASAYGTTIDTLLELNPQVTNPNLITAGEVLQIQPGAVLASTASQAGASLVVRPVVNGSGSKIKVSVKGFPGKAPLLVSAYPLSNPHAVVSKQATTKQSGKADVTLKIPSYLDSYLGEAWVAQVSTTAGASLSLTSNSFYVETGSSPLNVTATFVYTVRPGDYLSLIARQYGTTVADIIALNPEITSSKYVYPGEVLIIPARNLPEGYTPLVYTPEGYLYPNTPISDFSCPPRGDHSQQRTAKHLHPGHAERFPGRVRP